MHVDWPTHFRFISKNHPDGVTVAAPDICGYAQSIAEQLRGKGIGSGDRVALWLTNGPDKIAAVLGCWMAGAAFCILPSFAGRTTTDRSKARIATVFAVLEPKVILQGQDDPLPQDATGNVPTLTLTGAVPSAPEGALVSTLPDIEPDQIAFIQFTSGSTGGTPKGAEVRFGQLQANLDTLAKRTKLTHADHMVSWAPLYHDMGLMAVLLALRSGAGLTLMETDHFVRKPSAWLDAISTSKGTITTAPPTALKLLTRRRASGVDLSTLRYAWIGGEAVFPKVAREFEECYAEAGLAKGVIQPTYGMAETVVGISCGHPGGIWEDRDGIISCGEVLDGMTVEIHTDDGTPLAAGLEGRIMVKGPSVIDGYLGLERFAKDGWFETGDRGFLRGGRLFITGRIKDVLKRGAESYPASLVETIAEEALALKTGRVAAFTNFRSDLGKEEIVLLVESRAWDDKNARLVASAVLGELGLQVDVIQPAKGGRLPRTSSGKLMRQMAAKQYQEGLL